MSTKEVSQLNLYFNLLLERTIEGMFANLIQEANVKKQEEATHIHMSRQEISDKIKKKVAKLAQEIDTKNNKL